MLQPPPTNPPGPNQPATTISRPETQFPSCVTKVQQNDLGIDIEAGVTLVGTLVFFVVEGVVGQLAYVVGTQVEINY